MSLTYVVVKETPGYHIDSYSDTEDVFDSKDPYMALAEADRQYATLKSHESANFYVEVRLEQ
ncbi:hypothetical protein D3C85_346270 [compost metagenome]